jgi:hypothetical protein
MLTRRTIVASLKEFLEAEAEKLRTEQAEALSKRQEWIATVSRLLSQIKVWLDQADTQRILMIEEAPLRLSEQGLGTYEIPSLTIGLGPREVRVKPIARYAATPLRSTGVIFIPRVHGRVDMTDGLNKYLIFRVETEPTDRWSIIKQDSSLLEPFDQDSFASALKGMLE